MEVLVGVFVGVDVGVEVGVEVGVGGAASRKTKSPPWMSLTSKFPLGR